MGICVVVPFLLLHLKTATKTMTSTIKSAGMMENSHLSPGRPQKTMNPIYLQTSFAALWKLVLQTCP